MKTLRYLLGLGLLLSGISASAESISIDFAKCAGCKDGPKAQFGQYIGDWKIEAWNLKPDGSSWVPQPDARWKFVCVGDGIAVQDFWIKGGEVVGTNLRVYNAETESWEIDWISKNEGTLKRIRAQQQDDGRIVMRYVTPETGPLRRITFVPPDDTGWDWELEMSFDQGESWRQVARMRASPFAGEE